MIMSRYSAHIFFDEKRTHPISNGGVGFGIADDVAGFGIAHNLLEFEIAHDVEDSVNQFSTCQEEEEEK